MNVEPQQRVSYRSGQLAKLTGVSSDTLRHYERIGVLPPPARAANGYREYPAEALERVLLVRRALFIGFTLDELAQFLRMRDRGEAPCRQVRALAAAKLDAIETQIRDLMALREELRGLLQEWDARLAETPEGVPTRLLANIARSAKAERPGAGCRPGCHGSRPSGERRRPRSRAMGPRGQCRSNEG
jgi:DNA-binding transcriptional MerR regulator